MKKFLSLVLALVMTMSLVTVGAGAKDFADNDAINYDEAVAVISAVKVVDGYADGKFNPQGSLTRGAAAKIICNLILGPTTAAELHADTAPYKDVPVDHTFAGYIAYCAKEGIISGYADGSFRPAASLTGYAFMKMLLGALGYDSDVEGFVGANWSINVAKRALGIGLNANLKDEFNGVKAVTREEACLYAFNTLKATMVDYEAKTTVSVGGANVVVAGSTAKDVLWTGSKNADGNVKDDNKVQFAEKYFAKLVAKADEDVFGRPATAWVYDKKDVGSYVDYEKLAVSYTTKVEGGEVYKDIGSNAADYALTYYVNGVALDKKDAAAEAAKLVKKGDKAMKNSGKGVLTEVYVDNDAETLTIVSVDTYLAIVSSDYSEKNETLRVKYYKDENGTTKTVKLDDVANLADFEDGDIVLVTVADGTVVSMADAESVSDVTITSYSTSDKDAGDDDYNTGDRMTKITADGTKYEAAAQAWWEYDYVINYDPDEIDDATFNLYLDPYGYVIGVELVDAAEEYIFVVGYEASSPVLSGRIDAANLITTEGEFLYDVDIKLSKTMDAAEKAFLNVDRTAVNAWFEYTMDGDVYVLEKRVEDQLSTNFDKINSSNTTLARSVEEDGTVKYAFGNANSTYIVVETDENVKRIEDVASVSTGIKNVDIAAVDGAKLSHMNSKNVQSGVKKNVFAMYNGSAYVTYAVVLGEDANSTDNLVFITSGKVIDKTYVSKEVGYVYTYECIINNEMTTVQLHEDAVKAEAVAGKNLQPNQLFKVTYDGDGYGKAIKHIYADEGIINTLNTDYLKVAGAFAANGVTDVEFVAEGATMYLYDTYNNSTYAVLDDECVFWVKNTAKDATGKKLGNNKWEKFVDAEDAIDELGIDSILDGNFAIIADKDTGYATSVIFFDTTFEVEPEDEVIVAGKGDIIYKLQIVAKDTGAVLTEKEHVVSDYEAGEYDGQEFANIATSHFGVNAADFKVLQDNTTVKVVKNHDTVVTYIVYAI